MPRGRTGRPSPAGPVVAVAGGLTWLAGAMLPWVSVHANLGFGGAVDASWSGLDLGEGWAFVALAVGVALAATAAARARISRAGLGLVLLALAMSGACLAAAVAREAAVLVSDTDRALAGSGAGGGAGYGPGIWVAGAACLAVLGGGIAEIRRALAMLPSTVARP